MCRTPIQTNLRDDGLVGKRHGESADGVLLEAVVEVAEGLVGLHLEAVVEELGAARGLAVLVPDPEGVGADVGLLDEGHAQPDEAGALPGDVDAIGGEEWDAVEGELELGLRVAVDEGGESCGHPPEDDKWDT